ncbi:MAG: Flp pilus assembly complex ATPase component TadA, partial [Clostridia bacterium]|nr:Flp pilus assembly complex ATPase component TadA [Clostridia bacterium]
WPRGGRAAAAPLLPHVLTPHGVNSLLIAGPPASGKTTVLRDLAQSLSLSRHVAVVDERCELSLGDLSCCDVLKACPKSVGILQAVRTLSPDAVVADELGEEAEWAAVIHSCFGGVAVIASVHAQSTDDLLARRVMKETLENGAFSRLALLPPRGDPHGETRIWKVREFLENGGSLADRVRLRGDGTGGVGGASQTGETVGSVDGAFTAPTTGTALFRAAV